MKIKSYFYYAECSMAHIKIRNPTEEDFINYTLIDEYKFNTPKTDLTNAFIIEGISNYIVTKEELIQLRDKINDFIKEW